MQGVFQHLRNIRSVVENFRRKQSEALAWTVIGVNWALDHKISASEVDFNSIKTKAAFAEFQKSTQLIEQANRTLLYRFKPSNVYLNYLLIYGFKGVRSISLAQLTGVFWQRFLKKLNRT